MKFRELALELEKLGYSWARGNGGHQIFTHPDAIRPMIISMDNKEIGHVIAQKTIKKAKRNLQK